MPFDPHFAGTCRETHCTRAAGVAGYCRVHLASALSHRTLTELVDMLESVVDGALAEMDGEEKAEPLLN